MPDLPATCGCAARAARDVPSESPHEPIETPFEWDDVRDAMEALAAQEEPV
jgi:hypothetical protein